MNQLVDENTTDALAERLAGLTSRTERAVAEYLVGMGTRAGAMSAREVADATGTSDASVIRTARSLGYQSFRDLRRSLSRRADDIPVHERLHASLSASDGPEDQFQIAIDQQRIALDAMAHGIAPSELRAANQAVQRAQRVWWSGIGPSVFLAEYGAFMFRRLGKDSGAFTHSGVDNADELLALRSGDAVIVLAYGRLHRHARVLLDRAGEQEVPVILITDSVPVPNTSQIAARLASGRGTRGRFSSHGTTIVLIEALALTMAATDPENAEQSVTLLNELRQSIAGRPLEVDRWASHI